MRGFLLGALVLVAMDVLLTAPATRVETVFNRPVHWLKAWMDPAEPLIPQGHLSDTAPGGGGGSSTSPQQLKPGILAA